MRKPAESRRYRRGWYPSRPPYGYEDLPGRGGGCEVTVGSGMLTETRWEPPGDRDAVRAVTWDLRHPRDVLAVAVLRDPATMPCELGWEAAHDLHDAYQLSNALLGAR